MNVQFGQLVAWESAELPKEIHFFRVDSHISQIHVKQFYKKLFIPLTEELPSTKIHNYRKGAGIVARPFCCIGKLMSTNMPKISKLFKFEHL